MYILSPYQGQRKEERQRERPIHLYIIEIKVDVEGIIEKNRHRESMYWFTQKRSYKSFLITHESIKADRYYYSTRFC